MKVKATKMGIDPQAKKRRREGEVFDYTLRPEEKLPSWMKPVDETEEAPSTTGKGTKEPGTGKQAKTTGKGTKEPGTGGAGDKNPKAGGDNAQDLPGTK